MLEFLGQCKPKLMWVTDGVRLFGWRQDTQANNIQYNDSQHNDIQYIDRDNLHTGAQHNNPLSIMTFE